MNNVLYQNTYILENFYTDNYFNYILTSSLYTHRNSFTDILSYVQTYIPNWNPVILNPNNRIVFNSNTMFELLFYKNIFIIIPLYVSNYSILEKDLFHIKQYCEKYILEDDKNNINLITQINYKLYIYSTTTSHAKIKYKHIVTNKTIINTNLYTNMYESFFFTLPENILYDNNPLYLQNTTTTITNTNSNNNSNSDIDAMKIT